MDDSRDQRAMRASDADRERVADLLREAASAGRLSLTELDERIEALYAAKTYGELEPVVQDLPGILPEAPAPARRPSPEPAERPAPGRVTERVGGTPSRRNAKAVFSAIVRRGEWIVPTDYRIKAVFGGVELDLREARLESDEVDIRVTAVFGGANIFVPEDLKVVVDGDGFLGGFADVVRGPQPPDGAPVVRVSGTAVFGGVNVRRKTVGEK